MSDTWSHPDANEEGFVSFITIQQAAKSMDLGDFLAAFPRPCLRFIEGDASGSSPLGRLLAPDRGVQLLTERIEGAMMLRYLAKAAFVTKRPGNPFPHLISIGRSKANDITVAVESVSKVHGYFVTDGESWRFTDHGSTNGSRVGRRKVAKGEEAALEEGAVLKLGFDVCFKFHTPLGLYKAARA